MIYHPPVCRHLDSEKALRPHELDSLLVILFQARIVQRMELMLTNYHHLI